MIAHAYVGAAGLLAAIFLVLFGEEGGIHDMARSEPMGEGVAHQDMVEASPASAVLVGASCAVLPARFACNVGELVAAQPDERAVAGIVVEVAGHDDVRAAAGLADGVGGGDDALCHPQAVGAGGVLAADAAGRVHHHHVQRVASGDEAAGIQDVAGGMPALGGTHGDGVVGEQAEGEGGVEQGHVDAALVARPCHHILVAGVAQQRAAGEVVHHRIVLHLGEGHEVGQCPCLSLAAAHDDGAGDAVQLRPVAAAVPFPRRFGQILIVVLALVVSAVEEVLAVELHKGEPGGEQQGDEHGCLMMSFNHAGMSFFLLVIVDAYKQEVVGVLCYFGRVLFALDLFYR